MNTVIKSIAVCSLLCLFAGTPALAAGPIDGEVAVVWWANEFSTDTDTAAASSDAEALGLTAQMWVKKRYGLRASQFGSNPDGSSGADYTSVDLLWKALAPSENNFVALGLGWQQMDMQGLDDSTSGARVIVEGRVGLGGSVFAYGHGSYLPSMSDSDAVETSLGRYEDLDAYEYEVGVAWNALSFMDVHAGYRANNLSYSLAAPTTLGAPGQFSSNTPASGAISGIDATPAGEPCIDCDPNAVITEGGENESAGFFVGVGFRF